MNVEIDLIKAKIKNEEYVYSLHADLERKSDDLTLQEVENALLNGEILEEYPDTGRGVSCLIVGFSNNIPIHIVCGWREDKILLITTYIPKPPKFIDPWTRGKRYE